MSSRGGKSFWGRFRLPSGQKLTFLYVPDDAAVRQFRVPKLWFHGVVAIFLIGLGLIGYFGTIYLRAAAEGREMLRLRHENAALHERLDAMTSHLVALEDEMLEAQEIQQRLRLMANLDPMHPDVLEAGIGGPGSRSIELESPLAEQIQQNIDVASSQLSLLLRKAKVQRESYQEILTVVEANQKEWDRTPSVRPLTSGFLSSRFGRRMDPFTGQAAMHRGMDFVAGRGAPIRATADGTVTLARRRGGYGLLVEIDHGNGLKTRYAHCSKILVKTGQKVRRGDVIARVGSTGRSTSTHVHYEVLKDGMHQDPMKFLLPAGVVVD